MTVARHLCRARDRRFPMLVMAPEGTCGDGRCILRFRTGAFVPGVPVLPICFRYNKRRINPAWTIINEGWHFVSVNSSQLSHLSCKCAPPLYCGWVFKNIRTIKCRIDV